MYQKRKTQIQPHKNLFFKKNNADKTCIPYYRAVGPAHHLHSENWAVRYIR